MFSLKTRRDKWRILGIGIASFLTIFPLCAWRHLDIIEKDIYERALAALADARLPDLEISVSGRDLVLTDLTGFADLQAAVEMLENVHGVRKVTATPKSQAMEND